MSTFDLSCQACLGTDFEPIWSGYARTGNLGEYSKVLSTAWRCNVCHSVFIRSEEKYDESNFSAGIYRKQVDGQSDDREEGYFRLHKNSTLDYLKVLDAEMIFRKSLLDFGCGAGLMLNMLSEYTERAVGIDLDILFHRQGARLSIVGDFVQARALGAKYDTITCFSTIGHIGNPEQIVREFRNTLKPDGYLVIGCINPDDILLKVTGNSYSKVFYRSNYPNCFSESGLKYLMERHDLQHCRTIFKQRYGWKNFLEHVGVDSDSSGGILEDDLYRSLVQKQGLSDYMYLVFRRR